MFRKRLLISCPQGDAVYQYVLSRTMKICRGEKKFHKTIGSNFASRVARHDKVYELSLKREGCINLITGGQLRRMTSMLNVPRSLTS